MASGSGSKKEEGGRRTTRSGQKALEQENRKREILIRNNEISQAFLQPNKVIGPRDIILDSASGKVKVETGDETEPVEKKPRMDVVQEGIQNEAISQLEVEGLESGSGLEELPVIVKEEVDLGLDTEGPEKLEAVGTDVEETMVLEETSATAQAGNPGLVFENDQADTELNEGNQPPNDDRAGDTNLLEENLELKRMLEEKESKLQEQSARIKHLQKSLEEMTLQQQKKSSGPDSAGDPKLSLNLHCYKPILFELEPIPEPVDARTPEMEVSEAFNKLTTLGTEQQQTEPSSGALNTSEQTESCSNALITSTGSSETQKPVDTEETKIQDEKAVELFFYVVRLLWDKRDELNLTPTDFRQTRQVCSAWKTAVNWIEKGPFHNCQQSMIMTLFYGCKSVQETRIKGVWKFKPMPDGPGTNRLLVSDMGSFCSKEERAKCNEKFGRAIQAVGHSIKHLLISRLSNGTDFGDPLDWYLSLIEWLPQMPNLKSIEIVNECWMGGGIDTDISDQIAGQCPFPKIPKMEEFAPRQWPAEVARAVLMTNDQIISLRAGNSSCKLNLDGISLPKLKQLTLSAKKDSTCLETLSRLEAPALETLNVGDISGKDVFPLVLSAVMKFRNSLKSLSITIPGPEDFSGLPGLICLQKLHLYLKVSMGPNCWPADKLLQLLETLPALEYLMLRTDYGCNCRGRPCDYKEKRKVLRRRHIENDLISKLWTTLPNLTKVHVSFTPCDSEKFVFIRQAAKKSTVEVPPVASDADPSLTS